MENLYMRSKNNIVFLFTVILSVACSPKKVANDTYQSIPIIEKALSDTSSVYFADYGSYPSDLKQLPIGIFDSGTGGLTVLEAFLSMDEFNNESFRYLADQANMPYGNYASENKLDYFRELVVKDALFLTTEPNRSKIVVIACNTATAYGLKDVQHLLEKGVPGVSVVGVIDAGVNASLDKVRTDGNVAIGVMATVGTISSGGYQKTIKSSALKRGFKDEIKVVCQPGMGFAEAVDMEIDYIDKNAAVIRDNYRGPVIGKDSISIDTTLLDRYRFNFANNSMLYKKSGNKYVTIQLNSAANYARLYLVNLIERHRLRYGETPIDNIILGCTHYPFLLDTLNKVVSELRDYKKDGVKIYDKILLNDFEFIDPSIYTAREVYQKLKERKLLADTYPANKLKAFITVPAETVSSENIDKNGNFTYQFKYGREAGSEIQTFCTVPFSIHNVNPDNLHRIEERLPHTWQFLKEELK
jgi:glutamate racemase